jgi:hypothetical protein
MMTKRPKKAAAMAASSNLLVRQLFDELFPAPSWAAWKAFVSAIFAQPVTDREAELIRRCTERATTPTKTAREVWVLCGRRAGKSQVAALLAVYLACFRTYKRSHGERLIGMLVAGDRDQARNLKDYISGLLKASPLLQSLIVKELTDEIELTGITIRVVTSSYKAVRGYSCAFVICDEVGFWERADSSNPAAEVIRALRPTLLTTNGLLICLTSPYAAEGPAYTAYQRHFGADEDPVFVWMSSTDVMNPSVDPAIIASHYIEDPEAAASDYGRDGRISFRADLAPLFSPDALAACTIPGRHELAPVAGTVYSAFVDPSGGSSDSFSLALSHKSGDGLIVLDLVREFRPPFDPSSVVRECVDVLRRYGCASVAGDKYGGVWVSANFEQLGVHYQPSDEDRSAIYLECLPLVNSGQVQLLDHARMLGQFTTLQRRAGRSGKDAIDHPQGRAFHDDVANAAAGSLLAAARGTGKLMVPSTFTSCNRVESGLPSSGVCYIFGGSWRPPEDACCRPCVAHAFVKSARQAHQTRVGHGVDLIQFYRDFVELNEPHRSRVAYRQAQDAAAALGI